LVLEQQLEEAWIVFGLGARSVHRGGEPLVILKMDVKYSDYLAKNMRYIPVTRNNEGWYLG